MIPRFSLKYGDDFIVSDSLESEKTESGFIYTLPDGVIVTLKAE